MPTPSTILISGWRFLPHSYAVVNQFQCLELLRRTEIHLAFEDMPYYSSDWKLTTGLFSAQQEALIRSMKPLAPGQAPDAELRMVYPYDMVRPPRARRTLVFGTSEYGAVPSSFVAGGVGVGRAMEKSPTLTIITPSNWSRQGFINSGAPPQRVVVVPHGVDVSLFRPPTPAQREQARRKLGLADSDLGDFVFLNLSAMTGNKGLGFLIRAFAQVLEKHPTARLVLKGLDALYSSKAWLTRELRDVEPAIVQRVLPRLTYIGQHLAFEDIARLYHLADCYVAPYLAEGFNLPVLEAAASGLPVICTAGGPTDDFVTPDFAQRIPSSRTPTARGAGDPETFALIPSLDHLHQFMLAAIEQPEVRTRAREAGPRHVAAHFTWKHVVDRLLEVMSA